MDVLTLPSDRVEGLLLDPRLGPQGAGRYLRALAAAQVRRAVLSPWLLSEIGDEERGGLALGGAVDVPGGGATLASKRMGLLECLRLEASGAVVALTPGWLAEAGHGDRVAREVEALLATAPELPLRLLLPPFPLEEERWSLLCRLLAERRPKGIVLREEALGERGEQRLAAVRKRLPRKVRVEVVFEGDSRERAAALLAAGADGLLVPKAEALLGGMP